VAPLPAPQYSQTAPRLPSLTPPRETSAIAVPAQANTAPAAPPDTETRSASPPTVVNGRVLGPLDRFNAAHLTYRFDPDYPAAAKERRIEGTVDLHLTIGANGSVENVKPVSGPRIFFDAAEAAVKNWRFLPALLNGQPVETEQDVKVDFRLPRSSGK
jgi:protein TonB